MSDNQQGTRHKAQGTFNSTLTAIGGFETSPVLALAISGGPDSMALCLLAKRWAEKNGASLIALTVDHGLREESGQEAMQVSQWCRKLGIVHYTLEWTPGNIASGLQEKARAARYRLMTAWCNERHILHLLTAHHLDDQAETLMMRVARGSGIDGLACMPYVQPLQGIRLVRPLLGMTKAQLKTVLRNVGQSWLMDPTNQNMRYTRNRIRMAMASSTDLAERSAYIIQGMASARNLLENKLAERLTDVVSIYPEGYAILHLPSFLKLEQDYGLRALSHLAQTLGGVQEQPRSEKLNRLYDEICLKKTTLRRSFSGLLFSYSDRLGDMLICREPNAVEGPLEIDDSHGQIWDGRFLVSCKKPSKHPVFVRAVGADGLAILEKAGIKPPNRLKKQIIRALPSFWRLEELIAVPHMAYSRPGSTQPGCHAVFSPAKPLAGAAFFSMNRGHKIVKGSIDA